MNALIVIAHPHTGSLTHALATEFQLGLEEAGHTAELSDLYAMHFNPCMSEDEFLRETCRTPDRPIEADVEAEHAKILRADALAIFYPLWWTDCPAILKGWFDRVHSREFAYKYEGGKHVVPDSYRGVKKAYVFCAAGRSNEDLDGCGMTASMKQLMINDRLLGVGVQSAEFVLYGSANSGDEGLAKCYLGKTRELGRSLGQ